jgi:hypothetical protein
MLLILGLGADNPSHRALLENSKPVRYVSPSSRMFVAWLEKRDHLALKGFVQPIDGMQVQ